MRVKVARVGELAPETSKLVKAGGAELALHYVGGAYYATEALCPHRGGPLAEAYHDGATVMCKWHGWQFDVTTGSCTNIPGQRIKTYPVSVEGDEIYVEVSETVSTSRSP